MEVIFGFICLIIIVIVMIVRGNRKERHDIYYKYSKKYKDDFQDELSALGGDRNKYEGKAMKKSLKKIKSDLQEKAYINDCINDERLKSAQKQMKLIEKNKIAFLYIDVIKTLWPDRASHSIKFTKEEIIHTIKKLYKDNQNPEETFSDLIKSQILLGPLFGKNDYGLGIDAIFHPDERDKSGRRIVLLNHTIWSQPQETF